MAAFASGAGIDLLIAAKKVDPTGHVIGIDMTDEMIDKARQNIDSSGWNKVEVRRGLIEETWEVANETPSARTFI
ncbi:MAG: methyltransferase domain-containing protein [Candidatus Omnitrophica bacterium]|nr:methyltransferase domain-containing protein [Candidatus Omnitrophota bacterium]